MGTVKDFLNERLNERALKWWDRRGQEAETMDLAELRDLRSEARRFRNRMNRINHPGYAVDARAY